MNGTRVTRAKSPFVNVANYTGCDPTEVTGLREDLLFAVVSQLEQAMPWTDRKPQVVAG
jgi:hypothetical protein